MGTQAERFAELFKGLERAYGRYDLRDPTVRSDGKLKGVADTVKRAPTLDVWASHLAGDMGLGIAFLRDDAMVTCAAFDLDLYDLDLLDLRARIQALGLPLVVCRSKSEGAHCYAFFSEPVPAWLARQRLQQWLRLLGYGSETEVFPKHDRLDDNVSVGNWINLPYFAGDRTVRYAVGPEGALSLDEFLDYAESSRVNREWLESWQEPAGYTPSSGTSSGPSQPSPASVSWPSYLSPYTGDPGPEDDLWYEAPPCLCTLAATGWPPGTRNNALVNIGIYLKKRYPGDWQKKLIEYNDKFTHKPIHELMSTSGQVNRKNYNFMCSKAPIAQVCDKLECVKRRFGVNNFVGADVFPVTFGKMYKLDSQPPIWRLQIDGRLVELTTEQWMIQRAFIARVLEETNDLLRSIKTESYDALVREKSHEAILIKVAADTLLSGEVMTHLSTFCTGKARARELDEILIGRPWTADGRTYFLPSSFVEFLTSHKCGYTRPKLAMILNDLGLQEHEATIKGHPTRFWSVPEQQAQTEPFMVPRTEEEEGPF